MEAAVFSLLVGVLIAFGCPADGAEYCVVNNRLKYCENDCCNDSCCGLSTSDIVGLAIGGVMLLIMLVSCVACVICLLKKKKYGGSNVQPIHNSNSVYVNNNPYSHPPPRAPPPGYNQYNNYPPPATSNFNRYDNDMAYPPGTASYPPPYTSGKY